jgi:hypothetical protein
MDARGVLQELEEMMQEGAGDVEHLQGVSGYGVSVSDDGFVAFVDAEGEAADAAAVEGDETWEDTRVEILQEEFGGALIVPTETLLPGACLGFEQRAELASGEMPQVEDFELGRDSHFRWYFSRICWVKVFVEIIGICGRTDRRGEK